MNSVKRNHIVKGSKTFKYDVMFGLFINYIPQQKMPAIDRGEKLLDSDFIPYRNTRDKVKTFQIAPSCLPKQKKGKKVAVAVSSSSSSSSFEERRETGEVVPQTPPPPVTEIQGERLLKDLE